MTEPTKPTCPTCHSDYWDHRATGCISHPGPFHDKPTGPDGACSYCNGRGCKACSARFLPKQPTGRMSPLLCTDCEKFYGEVAENDIINAVTAARLHKDVCPKRDKPTGLTDTRRLIIWREVITDVPLDREGSQIKEYARRIEAIVRKDELDKHPIRMDHEQFKRFDEITRKDERGVSGKEKS